MSVRNDRVSSGGRFCISSDERVSRNCARPCLARAMDARLAPGAIFPPKLAQSLIVLLPLVLVVLLLRAEWMRAF